MKLPDFGIAKSLPFAIDDAATKAGDLLGTPWYMSPEQLTGSRATLDARSDLWAVGVLVFEALTGRRPFSAPTLGEQVLLVHSGHKPALGNTALDGWFAKACARASEDRFATAIELSSALSAALRGVVMEPPPACISAAVLAPTLVQNTSARHAAARDVAAPGEVAARGDGAAPRAKLVSLLAAGAGIVGAGVAIGIMTLSPRERPALPRASPPADTAPSVSVDLPAVVAFTPGAAWTSSAAYSTSSAAPTAPTASAASAALAVSAASGPVNARPFSRRPPRAAPSAAPSTKSPPPGGDDDIE